jgi:hypothetical protein
MEYELLPNFILTKSIISEGGTIAWNKNDIFEAIEEINKLNYAILGGDVWAINIKNITRYNIPIDYSNIYVGIIPDKNGKEFVCNWHSEKEENENWLNYIKRSKQETINYINKSKIENMVELDLKIYYNLVCSNELNYIKLSKMQ